VLVVDGGIENFRVGTTFGLEGFQCGLVAIDSIRGCWAIGLPEV
jgi:hypothetical protein